MSVFLGLNWFQQRAILLSQVRANNWDELVQFVSCNSSPQYGLLHNHAAINHN
jgi:hypothetical protein